MMYRLVISDPRISNKAIDWLYDEEHMYTVKRTARLLMRRLRERKARLIPYGYSTNGPIPPTITITVR
jgi:hypothetical protein